MLGSLGGVRDSMELYWYTAHQNLMLETPSDAKERLYYNYLGYLRKPTNEDIKRYDLRFVVRGTRADLTTSLLTEE